MKAIEIKESIKGEILTNNVSENDFEITGAYVCDMLSRVISKIKSNQIWITILNSINVIAVASLSDCKIVVLAENVKMDESTLQKAVENEITIISTPLSAYEVCIEINKRVESLYE